MLQVKTIHKLKPFERWTKRIKWENYANHNLQMMTLIPASIVFMSDYKKGRKWKSNTEAKVKAGESLFTRLRRYFQWKFVKKYYCCNIINLIRSNPEWRVILSYYL
jgi:hypothetical protein